MKHKVKSGGKLYLAGEYAILTAGQSALIKQIPVYMQAEIEPSSRYHLESDMFDYAVDLTPDSGYALIQDAVAMMETYLVSQGLAPRPFSLVITGKMEKEDKKFGLGSSGSVVVLTVRAVAALYGLTLSPDLVFRLAAAILLKHGDNGSMGDVACIAYDDLVVYTSFDRARVAQALAEKPLEVVLKENWGYTIQVLKPAVSCDFLVGWTKQPSLSRLMIQEVQAAITEEFLEATNQEVKTLAQAMSDGDKKQVVSSLARASQLLEDLSPKIYPPMLRRLKESATGLDAVAKSSGAGGGDCGIALSFSLESSLELKKRWQKQGIEVLYEEKMGPNE
ncbi:phosphomevalonate kinase [Streptococcus himalayensis]|uniref:phosphomevalonate kinase n=1 Tax=Streptococcus himalayensis TaxID=1888195 RepID=A0A917A943_9STRE|nr:phosphomevalonate kinase [Streptococcus himalayensis]GGE35449.1 phosphomevalonate kinase [Streptococcus himalayensis]